MKNSFFLLNFFFLLFFATLFSCQKTIEEPLEVPQEAAIEEPTEPWRSADLVSTRSSGNGYGYIDQAHLDKVSYVNGLIQFDSLEELTGYIDYLDSLVEVHNDAFYSLYGNMSDEALDSLEEQLNFDEDQPLLDFEDYFQFPSLRKKIAGEVDIWLQDTVLDFQNNPENHPIIDDALRTLTDENGRLKIDTATVDMRGNDLCDFLGRDCCAYGSTDDEFEYNYGGRLRMMYLKIKLSYYGAFSEVKGKTVSYKRKSDDTGWKKDKTKIYVSIRGDLRNIDCNGRNSFFKDRPIKKRKKRSVRWRYWGAPRYAQDGELNVRARYPDRGNEENALLIDF